MRGGRLIPTRNSGPLGVFRRRRIARPGRSRSFRGFTFLRAHVYFFICHLALPLAAKRLFAGGSPHPLFLPCGAN